MRLTSPGKWPSLVESTQQQLQYKLAGTGGSATLANWSVTANGVLCTLISDVKCRQTSAVDTFVDAEIHHW